MLDPTQAVSPPLPAQAPVGGVPVAPPAGPGLGLMPAALAGPARNPNLPPPPLKPPPDPTNPNTDPAHIRQPADPEAIRNIFERRGALLALAVQTQGQRLAEAMAQPPTNATKLEPGQITDYWNFSPVAADQNAANDKFWQVHDQVLQQTGDPAQAEQQAMQQVFPYRVALVGQGVASIERQVQMAEQIRGVVEGQAKPDAGVIARDLHAHVQGLTNGY